MRGESGRGILTRAAALAVAFLPAACAAVPGEAPEEPGTGDIAAARAADDAALAGARASLAPMEGHTIAVAGGKVLGGAMLLEDAARLLREAPGGAAHAYLFTLGSEGDRAESVTGLYGPRIAGAGLLAALGIEVTVDAPAGLLTMGRGSASRTFPFEEGRVVARLTVEPASGLGTPRELTFLVSTGSPVTALVSREDAESLGLALSEVPGEAALRETLRGTTLPCRRALCRVTLEKLNDNPLLRASALVEVLFPR